MDRLTQLREYMEKERLDAFYIAKPANVRCISGFTGKTRSFLSQRRISILSLSKITQSRHLMNCPDYELVKLANRFWLQHGENCCYCADKDGVKTIGFEQDHLTFEKWNSMQAELSAEMVPTLNVIEGFRAIKTPEEIKNLTVACDIASRAFEKIIKDIRPGVTEKEIASRLAHYMVMEGADTKPYGGIVISGAKSSLLHGIPDSKPIEYGDFVLMDYGCQYKGYLSDMTRTVVVGKADAKQREVYDLCRRMTEDTEASVRAGVTGTSCYEASLEAIKDTEYLPYNYTGIGHGVGLFVHELPNIGLNCENILQENSIMTVEPGLYIPGWGGVRLEDQGIITKDGYENLISATHELIEL